VRHRVEFATAICAQAIGAGVVLLLAGRHWQTVTTPRPRPLPTDVLHLSGRTVDAAPTALALVALAGVVAVLATHGWVRRVVGAVVALAGAGMIWRLALATDAVSRSRAAALVRDKHPQVDPHSALAAQADAHPIWAVLSLVAAVLVVSAGVAIAVRGGRWAALSARYEAPQRRSEDPEQARARADASLWSALERGEDPTTANPRDAS
jgi:uncharacterized membrane protein (TIGR02234 family)